jgi:hypothetical protein
MWLTTCHHCSGDHHCSGGLHTLYVDLHMWIPSLTHSVTLRPDVQLYYFTTVLFYFILQCAISFFSLNIYASVNSRCDPPPPPPWTLVNFHFFMQMPGGRAKKKEQCTTLRMKKKNKCPTPGPTN